MGQVEAGGELAGNHLANTNIIMSGVGITEIDALYEPIERRVPYATERAYDGGRITARDELFAPIEEIASGAEVLEDQVAAELTAIEDESKSGSWLRFTDGLIRETALDETLDTQETAVSELEVHETEAVRWLRQKGIDIARSMRRRRSGRVVRANRDDGIHLPRDDDSRGVSVDEKAKDRWPQMPHKTTAKERHAAEQALLRDNRRKKQGASDPKKGSRPANSNIAFA